MKIDLFIVVNRCGILIVERVFVLMNRVLMDWVYFLVFEVLNFII